MSVSSVMFMALEQHFELHYEYIVPLINRFLRDIDPFLGHINGCRMEIYVGEHDMVRGSKNDRAGTISNRFLVPCPITT